MRRIFLKKRRITSLRRSYKLKLFKKISKIYFINYIYFLKKFGIFFNFFLKKINITFNFQPITFNFFLTQFWRPNHFYFFYFCKESKIDYLNFVFKKKSDLFIFQNIDWAILNYLQLFKKYIILDFKFNYFFIYNFWKYLFIYLYFHFYIILTKLLIFKKFKN